MKKFWLVLLLMVGVFGLTACDAAEDKPATEKPADKQVDSAGDKVDNAVEKDAKVDEAEEIVK